MSARKTRRQGGKPVEIPTFAKPRYSVEEASALLGISRVMAYLRIRSGELKSVRDGKRTFVTAEEVNRYARISHADSFDPKTRRLRPNPRPD